MPSTETDSKLGRPKLVNDSKRRAEIVDAAHAAFVELGFAHTTTAIIAARAKVSKRAIYAAFADKTELFGEIIRARRDTVMALPRPEGEDLPLLETLVRIFRLDIDDTQEREREALLNLINRESAQLPELSAYLYDNHIISFREDLMEWLEVEGRRGRLQVDDRAMLAGMLMDIVFGALLPRRRLQSGADRAIRIAHIRARLAIFLRGVALTG